MKNKGILISIILFILIIIGCCIYMVLGRDTSKKKDSVPEVIEEPVVEEPVKKLTIVDEDSDSRNIAVMYNNIWTVWGYQSGLQDAYLVYEIIVEGGYTRLMAIFKDKDTERIGSVRSARPYFLDYALENDSIYVHFGHSNQALSDIKTLGINNMNGMFYDKGFWRDKSLKLAKEHTAFTSMEKIREGMEYYSYRDTTTTPLLLNYNVDPVGIENMNGAIPANKVYISYSNVRSTTFEYNSEDGMYYRSQGTAKGTTPHIDHETKEQYKTKNIITYQLPNKTIDKKGRQEVTTIGSGEGYFITDGYAIPITWTKDSREAQTVYKKLDGTELEVNDGITYIEIQPKNRELVIE